MLINLRTMLKAASAKKMAVGAFNVYNVESLQAVLAATKASNHAVILSFGENPSRPNRPICRSTVSGMTP